MALVNMAAFARVLNSPIMRVRLPSGHEPVHGVLARVHLGLSPWRHDHSDA